jgi:hypothetical protein
LDTFNIESEDDAVIEQPISPIAYNDAKVEIKNTKSKKTK